MIDRVFCFQKLNKSNKKKRFRNDYIFCLTLETWRQLHKNVESNTEQVLAQHPTRRQLYGHLPPITKTIQVRRARHAGHCWRSKDELVSDVLLWAPTYGQAKAGRPARNYIQQLCEDTGCNPEDLPQAMNDREKWRERVRDIRAGGITWWWWWWWWYIYIWLMVILFKFLILTNLTTLFTCVMSITLERIWWWSSSSGELGSVMYPVWQNSSISNNSVSRKYSFNLKKQF